MINQGVAEFEAELSKANVSTASFGVKVDAGHSRVLPIVDMFEVLHRNYGGISPN